MTKQEVVKALMLCANWHSSETCRECPYKRKLRCEHLLMIDAANLLEKSESKNEWNYDKPPKSGEYIIRRDPARHYAREYTTDYYYADSDSWGVGDVVAWKPLVF